VSRDRSSKALSNTCLFTFVSVDPQMRPQQVPTIYPTTYREDELYLAAYRQRAAYVSLKNRKGSGQ